MLEINTAETLPKEVQQNDMDYVATIVLLFPDKVFHVRARECENHMPHRIMSCGLLKPMINIKNPLNSEEKAA